MTTTTRKFARLLIDAREWDAQYPELCHAQQGYLLDNFCFSDQLCAYANPIDRQKWDVPKVADGRLFTVCR